MKKRCSKAVSFGEEPRAIIVIANRVDVRLGFMAYFQLRAFSKPVRSDFCELSIRSASFCKGVDGGMQNIKRNCEAAIADFLQS